MSNLKNISETDSQRCREMTSVESDIIEPNRSCLEDSNDNCQTWLKRVHLQLSSPIIRKKVYYMIGLCIYNFFSGWVVSLKGPAFLDLQEITGVGTSKGAAFFTAAAVGAAVGNLVGGAIYDRYNRHIVLFFSSFLYGVTCAIIPWCSVYWTMVLIFLVHELVTGAARSGTNVEIVEEWGYKSKPFMQAFHFSFSIGATLSPFALEPFISVPIPITVETQNTTNTTEPASNADKIPSTPHTDSRIHYAFLIAGGLAVLSSFIFLIKYYHDKQSGVSNFRRKYGDKDSTKEEEELKIPHREKRHLPFRLFLLTILLFGLFYFFLDEVEDTTPSFLSTFVVQQLGWTKKYGSRLSAAFWASYTAGRGFGIIFVNFLSHVQIFTLCCTVLCLGQVGLLLSGMYQFGVGIWISIVSIGLAISVVFPASLTWTEKKLMQLSGKLIGVIYAALAIGGLVNPQIIGTTMEQLSPMWYSYVLCVESVLFSVTFVAIAIFVKRVLSKHRRNCEPA